MDQVTVGMYEERAEANLKALSEQPRLGEYLPQAVRRIYIPRPDATERPPAIPTVRDRVVRTALRNAPEPIFEKTFAKHSYGFRPRKGR